MKIAIASLMAVSAACLGVPSLTGGSAAQEAQQGPDDANKIYNMIKQSRADLREMRIAAGLHAHPAGPHIDPEGHHANDSPEQQAKERGEKSGHEDGGGEGGHEGGREGRGERGHEGGREGRGERGHEGGREGRGERGHEGGREGRGERGHEGGREGRGEGRREGGEGHEGREKGEHGGREGRREGGEGHEGREKGEHGGGEGRGEGRREGNREGKTRIGKNQKHDHRYKNGAHLTLEYNPATQAFVGHVKNTTKLVLPQVRVEIHLSNGRELGPTMRTNLLPGATLPIELSALDQKFTAWVTHPEAGTEEGHGENGEESEGHAAREKGEHGAGGGDEGSGEHGGGGEGGDKGDRPASAFRPVENQLLLLRGEMRAFKADLKAKNGKK